MTEIPELSLPGSWSRTTLADVRRDDTTILNPAKHLEERFELYSIPAHETGKPELVKGRDIGSAKKMLSPGTVLLSKINPRINRVWVVGDANGVPQIGSSEWIAFSPIEGIVSRYLAHYLRQDRFCTYLASNVSGVGGSLMRVKPSIVERFSFVFPPSGEQQRIVEAVDSYLTRLDDAVASLERVQAKLKAYRASVLKAAVEGRLVPTEASLARAGKGAYEPAEVLLARILKERRRRWEEAELTKLKANRKTSKDDKWKAKYAEPVAPDISTMPELPEGWCWATVDMLASVKGGLTKGQRRGARDFLLDVPYLRVANVQRGHLDLSEVKTIKATREEIAELRLVPGDVLFNEGGDRDKLGRGWIWNGEIETCIHQNHVFRARILTADYEPRLLSWYGNTSGQRYFFEEGKQTTNLASINITKLKLLPVPIPPKHEQGRIVDEVERVLSVADDNAVAIAHDMKRCMRLRQAVFKWAFEG